MTTNQRTDAESDAIVAAGLSVADQMRQRIAVGGFDIGAQALDPEEPQ
jgi:hypothetical protein